MRAWTIRWGAAAIAFGAIAGGFAGCGDDAPSGGAAETTGSRGDEGWLEVPDDRLTPAQRAAVDRGLAARDAMFSALLGRLGEAMADGGPAPAIDVCRVDAPRIAAEIAEARDLRIGRTSFKLRNPSNTPPGWAKPAVASRRETSARYVAADGTIGVLEPIMTLTACLACHGAPDQLAPGVAEAVAAAYPQDQATGFTDGSLRGWFWMQVDAATE